MDYLRGGTGGSGGGEDDGEEDKVNGEEVEISGDGTELWDEEDVVDDEGGGSVEVVGILSKILEGRIRESVVGIWWKGYKF